MFVVFEGIDGSGKTTVSNRVAAELRSRGIDLEHIREGGEFASALVSRMREFGKDPRNMAMEPMTELLLYVARDAQLLAESIEPALGEGGLVFADRYLYSYEVLGHHGRGVDLDRVRPILDAVAGGIWPDLVVLLDVDPHIARARRRVRKLERRARGEKAGGSRKGLGGVGMQHRMRDGYLELAASDPKRWLVVDNANSDLDEVIDRITNAVSSLFEGAPASKVVAATAIPTRAAPAARDGSLDDARRAFYEVVEERADSEPAVSAYFLAGLDDPVADDWRDRLADGAPQAVAFGLRGLDGERAWALREQLVDASPYFVARSLLGPGLDPRRAAGMRERLADAEPASVLSTLVADDSARAWALRDRLADRVPDEVLGSVKNLDDERAWQLREAFVEREGEAALASDPARAAVLVASLLGLDGERAWQLRELCLDAAPSATLASLAGVDGNRSWQWRHRYARQAPKIVLRTFDGQDHDLAWTMRRTFAPQVKEALDSMNGLGAEAAWAIREALFPVWPSTSVKSLGELAAGPRGQEFASRVLAAHPSNISLLKHVTQIVAPRALATEARRDAG